MYIFVLEPGGFARLEWLRGKIFKKKKRKKSEKSGVGVQQKPSCHQWIFKTPFEGEGLRLVLEKISDTGGFVAL